MLRYLKYIIFGTPFGTRNQIWYTLFTNAILNFYRCYDIKKVAATASGGCVTFQKGLQVLVQGKYMLKKLKYILFSILLFTVE